MALFISSRANLFYYSDAAEMFSMNNYLLSRAKPLRHLRPPPISSPRPAWDEQGNKMTLAAADNGPPACPPVKNLCRIPQITVSFDTNASTQRGRATLYPVKVIMEKSMSPGGSDMLPQQPWQFKYPVNKDNASGEAGLQVNVICNAHCSVRSLPLYYG